MNMTYTNLTYNTTARYQQTPEDVPFYTIALSIFMYSLIFMIGFFGNSLVIIVAYLNRINQHNTHYCLVNLSIADLLLIIVCMPSAIMDLFAKEVWYFGRFFCKIIPWLEHTVAHASILTIVSISIERSLAIALPLKAKQFFTNQRLWLVVVFIWVISTLSSIPIMLATSFRQAYHRHLATNVNICVVGTGQQWQLVYLYISLFMFYLLPCFSLFILYGNIVLIIKNRSGKKSVPQSQNSESLMIRRDEGSSQCQEHHDKHKLSVRQWRLSKKRSSIVSLKTTKPAIQLPQINHKQIIVLLIVMMMLIFVCLLPYRVFSLWVATASKRQLLNLGMVNYYNIITVCRVAFYTNSALNPIFYHIISTKFQTAFKRFFKFSFHGSSANLSRVSRRSNTFNRSNIPNNFNSHT